MRFLPILFSIYFQVIPLGATCTDGSNPPTISSSSSPTLTNTTSPVWAWEPAGGTSVTGLFRFELEPPGEGNLTSGATTSTQTIFTTATASSATFSLYVQEICTTTPSLTVSSITSYTIAVDLDPPSTPVLTGLTLTNDPTPTWSWTSGGGSSGTPTFLYSLNDADLFNNGITTTALDFTTSSTISSDIHTFYLVELDAVGNFSPTSFIATTVDLVAPSPPSISGTSPINTNTPTWVINQGGGDGINVFRIKIDDPELESGAISINQNFYQSGTALTETTHTLYAQERDSAGNWSDASQHAIVVDITAPNSPVVTAATPNRDGNPIWNWYSGGAGGNGNFQFTLFNDEASEVVSATSTTATSYTTALANDGYQFQVVEFDNAGNQSEAGISQISVDSSLNPAPTVAGPSSPTSNNNVLWTWSSNNGTPLAFLWNVDDSNVQGTGSSQGANTSTSVILSDGFHTIFVADTLDGISLSATGFHQVEVDTTPPEPPIVSLAGSNPTSNPEPTFNWVSGGNGGVGTYRYQLNDFSLSAPTVTTSLTFTPDGDLPEGENFLYVQERDSIGNWSTTASAIVTIDVSVPEPSIQVSSPTSNQKPVISWTGDDSGDGNGNFRYELAPPGDGDLETSAEFSSASTSFTTGTSLPEGTYVFFVQEQDGLGNWSESTTAAIVIDLTAPNSPVVSGVTPTNTGTPTWSWSPGGGAGSGDYRYKFEDSDLSLGAISTISESFTTGISLPEGTYTLYVQESDAAGNWSTSGSFSIEVDLSAPNAPSVTSTSPTSDTTPTWTWVPGGGGSGAYRYKLNDSSLQSGSLTTILTSFSPSSPLSDGIHILYVQEEDEAGNWSASGSFSVTVDTFVPAPVSLAVDSPTSDPTPVFSWASGGDDGNGTFRYELVPPGDGDFSSGSITVAGTSFETGTELPDGEYSFHVQERDALQNWSATSTISVTIDTTGPSAPSVFATTLVSNGTPTWTWTGDNSGDGIGAFRYKFNDPSLGSGAVSTTSLSFTTSTSLGDGTYTFYIQERDSLGNWSTTASISVEVDLSPPTSPSVSITSPTSDSTPVWSWSSGGGGSGTFRYKLNNSSLSSGATETDSTSFESELNLDDGSYILYVQERDAVGNWSAAGSAQVTLDTFVPTPSVLGTSLTSSDPPTWFWSSGGDDGIGTYRYKINNSSLESGATTTTATELTPDSSLGEGAQILYIQERDTLGNWSESGSFTIEIDTTAPSSPSLSGLSITSSSRPAWSWTPGGGGNGNFRYQLDDSDFSSGSTLTQSNSFLSGSDLSEGTHIFYVQESDAAGNWSSSGSFSTEVDQTPPNAPSVSGVSPTTSMNPGWTWSSGGNGNGDFRYKLDDSDLTISATHTTNTSFQVTLGLDDGSHTLYVQERDDAGNWSATGFYEIIIQNGAPNAPLVDGLVRTSLSQPTWSWSSGGGGGNGNFRFKLNDTDLTSGTTEGVTTSFTPSSTLTDGEHTLYVQEQNDEGEWSSTGFFTTTIDSSQPAAPSVTGFSPTSSTLPTWSWVPGGSGNGNFRYKFDDSSLDSGSVSTSALSFTTSIPLGEGTYTLYVQEENFEGIWSSSGSFDISVDLTPPSSPSVSALSPTTSQRPVWSWVSGGGGNGVYRYKLDDSDLSSGATLATTLNFTPELGVDDGDHAFYVQERDEAGNWSVSGSFTVTVQSGAPNAPSVTVLSISTNPRPTFSWESGGSGGTGTFRYRLNDSDLESASAVTTSTSFTPPFDLIDGTHILYVQEVNGAGLWSSTGAGTVIIDNFSPSPPSVAGITPTSDSTPTWTWLGTGGGTGTFRYSFNDSGFDSSAVSTQALFFTTGLSLPDGIFALYVQEKDEAGNFSGSGSFSIEVDTSAPGAPSVTASSPASHPRVMWSWSSQGGGAGIFRYKLDDSDLSSGATLNAGLGYTESSDLSDGAHTLYVQERDSAGNWSVSGSHTLTIDGSAPPAPTVTGPEISTIAKPTWTWTGDTGEDGAGVFRYQLNSDSFSSGSIETLSIEFTPSSSLADGNHTLYVQERDDALNWSTSGSHTILVDANIPPTPSVTGVPLTSSTSPTWSWSGDTGGDGIGTFRFKLDDSSLESGATTTTSSSIKISDLSDGEHIFYVQEQDLAGNWSLSGSFITTIDTTPPPAPSVSTDSPTSSVTPTWSWIGDDGGDGIGIYRYEFQDSSLETGSISTSATSFTTATTLSDGFFAFYVQERDLIGNWSSSGSVVVEVDTIPPSVPAISGSTITSSAQPTWTLSGGGGGTGTFRIDLVISGSCNPSEQTFLVSTAVFQVDTILNDGVHTLCAQERDEAGNWSSSASFITEVDTSIPGTPQVSGIPFTTELQPEWSWYSGGAGNGIFRISLNDDSFSTPTTITETSFSPTSPLNEGSHTLYVQERNDAGTWSESGSFTILIDLTPPEPPTVSSLLLLTRDRHPEWSWSAQGGGSGIFRFKLVDEDFENGGILTTGTQWIPLFPLSDGLYTLFVQERDQVGNWSDSGSFQLEVDGTAPNAPSVTAITPQSSSRPTWFWSSGGGGSGSFRILLDDPDLSSGALQTTSTSYVESFGLEDGNHTLYVQEVDEAGNWSAAGSFTVLVNTGLPNSPIVDGEEFSLDGLPVFSWISGGGGGNGVFRYLLDSFDFTNGGTQTTQNLFTVTSPLSEGEHTLYVQEQNDAGDWSVPGFFTTIVDSSAPEAPSVTGSPITSSRFPIWSWESNAGGSGVYRYELNDSDLSSGSLMSTTMIFRPAQELPDGVHILYVQEQDLSGNWSESGFFGIEVDTSAPGNPSVSSVTPLSFSTPTWTWESGGGGNGIFRYKLNSEDLSTGSVLTSALSFTELLGFNDGEHTLFVQERDAAGNWSGSGRFAIEIQTGKPDHPIVNGTTPTNNPRPIWFWTSGEAGGSGIFRFQLNDSEFPDDPGIPIVDTSFQPSQDLEDGKYTLYVEEQGASDWSVPGFFTIVVDTSIPEAPIVSGPSLTNEARPIFSWISGAGSDGSGIFRFLLDTQAFDSSTPVTSSSVFQPASALSEGSHTFYVQERDQAGNWSLSASLLSEVDQTPPAPPSVQSDSLTSDPNPLFTWTSGGGGSGVFRIKLDDTNLEENALEMREQGFFQERGLSNGFHTLYVQERDAAGNWSSSGSYTVEIDTDTASPPIVTALSLTNDPTPQWSWTSGGEGNGVFRLSLDQSTFTTNSITTEETFYIPALPLADGPHTLYVQESNTSGLWSGTGFFTLEIDTDAPVAPSVTAGSPTSLSLVSFQIKPGDEETVHFRYQLNSSSFGSSSPITDATFFELEHGLADGQHTVFAQAGDLAGNWSKTGFADFEVDTLAPSIPILTSQNVVAISRPTWTWSSGGGGIGIYRYRLNFSDLSTGAILTSSNSFTPAQGLNDGIYTLFLQERDLAGNWSENASFSVEIDTGSPDAPLVSGPVASNQALPTWTWISDAADGSGIFRYRLDNPDLETLSVETVETSFTPLSNLSEGRHTLFVQERNALGIWSVNGFFTIDIDTSAPQPPSVGGSTPTSDSTPTWTWTASGGGNGNYRIKLDDSDLSSGTTQTTSNRFTSSDLQDGVHILYVQERDSAGNFSSSGFFSIEVDTTPPSAPSVSSTSVSTIPDPLWIWESTGDGEGIFRYKLDDSDLSTGAFITEETFFQEPFGLDDGTYTLYVQERDEVGNWSSNGSFLVLVQTNLAHSPSVSAHTPTSSLFPVWSWAAVGTKGNGTFRYKLDDQDLDASGTKITTATSFSPLIGLSEGEHTLYVQEQNDDGEWGIRGSFTVEVDITPPVPPKVSGSSQTNDDTPTWTWIPRGETNEVYRYKLESILGTDLSGGFVQSTDRSFTPTSSLSEGTYRLLVQQVDLAGNWSDSEFLFITINLSIPNPPSVLATFSVTNDSTPEWSLFSADVDGDGVYRLRIDTDDFSGTGFEIIELPPNQFGTSYSPDSNLSDGIHRLYVQEQNVFGTWSPSGSAAILVDTSAPVSEIEPPSGIYNQELDLIINCQDGSGSGCFRSFLTTSSEIPTIVSTPLDGSLRLSSTATASYFSLDSAGNAEEVKIATYTLDFQVPTVTVSPSAGVYKQGQEVLMECQDLIGCEAIRFTTDGSVPTETSQILTGPIILIEDITLSYFAKDIAGNQSQVQSLSYAVDATSPVVIPSRNGGNYDFGFLVRLTCIDDRAAACSAIHYTVDENPPTLDSPAYSLPIPITSDTLLRFIGVDAVGNIGAVDSVSYSVPQFSLSTNQVFLTPGDSISFQVSGADQPIFQLSPGAEGNLVSQGELSVTYHAPQTSVVETLTVTDIIAGVPVSSSAVIRVINSLSATDSAGGSLSLTSSLGFEPFVIRASGGNGSYQLRQVSGPGQELIITEINPGVFQIEPPLSGSFAGTYRMVLEDPFSGFRKRLDFQVGFRLRAPRTNLLEGTIGSLKVLGGRVGEEFTAQVLRGSNLSSAAQNEGFFQIENSIAIADIINSNPATLSLIPVGTSQITSWVVRVRSLQRPEIQGSLSPVFNIFPSQRFEGRVLDTNGLVVPGSRIRSRHLRNASGQFYSAEVNELGDFILDLPLRPEGSYQFVVEAPGFLPQVIDGSGFQMLENQSLFATIRIQRAGFVSDIEVLGLDAGEEAELYALELTGSQLEEPWGPFFLNSGGSGIDTIELPLENSKNYTKITIRSEGYLSATTTFLGQGRLHRLVLSQPPVIEVSETLNPDGSLILQVDSAALDLSGLQVEALNATGQSLLPSISARGNGLDISFGDDQDFFLVLKNSLGGIVGSWNHSSSGQVRGLPGGFKEVNIEGGFQAEFSADDSFSDELINSVKIDLPPGGINQNLVSGLRYASVQVATRALSQPNEAANGLGQNVLEVQLDLIGSAGNRIDLSEGSRILRTLQITIPFDSQVVLPGDLESGKVKIWFASRVDEFESMNISSISPEDFVEIDYLNNRVSFEVDHLTVFALGSFQPPPTTPTEGQAPVSSCFIATAAFGGPQSFSVRVLSTFRDELLIRTELGSSFQKLYYQYSPPIADLIAKSPFLASLVSLLLIPIVMVVWVLNLVILNWVIILFILCFGIWILRRKSFFNIG